jgi:hypothetical protein
MPQKNRIDPICESCVGRHNLSDDTICRTTQSVGRHNLSDDTICRTTQSVGRHNLSDCVNRPLTLHGLASARPSTRFSFRCRRTSWRWRRRQSGWSRQRPAGHHGLEQGCHIFLGTTYQNGENDQKIYRIFIKHTYQIFIKYTKLS